MTTRCFLYFNSLPCRSFRQHAVAGHRTDQFGLFLPRKVSPGAPTQLSSSTRSAEQQNNSGYLTMENSKVAKRRLPRFTMFVAVVCLMAIPAPVMLIILYQDYTSIPLFNNPAEGSSNESFRISNRTRLTEMVTDMLIETTKFDTKLCISRSESHKYRKPGPYNPSPYLISKLRKYERLHRQCGPKTKSYKAAIKELGKYRNHGNFSIPCKYVVWTPSNGLGNRMLSLASTFLYGLLTDRVLLVEFNREAMTNLFCEPFPNSTWLLPEDFQRIVHGDNYKERNEKIMTFQTLMQSNSTLDENSEPSIVDINLRFRRGEDNLEIFHCDHTQELLHGIPALILKSDQYFVPSLFMMSSFEKELSKLFPEKEAAFNILGNYLFHPSNAAWEMITTFYQAYLAEADRRVGLQIRVFYPWKTPNQTIINEILTCTWGNNLLPKIKTDNTTAEKSRSFPSTAILAVSLHSIYGDSLKEMYGNYSDDSGQVIGVFQPSHEGRQKHNNQEHDIKAWVEMYLLSLSDVLVTSSGSTFGYVAQSLGGIKPWILDKVEVKKRKKILNPTCRQALSMEPCFHYPLKLGCRSNNTTHNNISAVFPYIRPCEDFTWGVKLVSGIY